MFLPHLTNWTTWFRTWGLSDQVFFFVHLYQMIYFTKLRSNFFVGSTSQVTWAIQRKTEILMILIALKRRVWVSDKGQVLALCYPNQIHIFQPISLSLGLISCGLFNLYKPSCSHMFTKSDTHLYPFPISLGLIGCGLVELQGPSLSHILLLKSHAHLRDTSHKLWSHQLWFCLSQWFPWS